MKIYVRKIIFNTVVVLMLFVGTPVYAVSLGEPIVRSAINEPLDVLIPLTIETADSRKNQYSYHVRLLTEDEARAIDFAINGHPVQDLSVAYTFERMQGAWLALRSTRNVARSPVMLGLLLSSDNEKVYKHVEIDLAGAYASSMSSPLHSARAAKSNAASQNVSPADGVGILALQDSDTAIVATDTAKSAFTFMGYAAIWKFIVRAILLFLLLVLAAIFIQWVRNSLRDKKYATLPERSSSAADGTQPQGSELLQTLTLLQSMDEYTPAMKHSGLPVTGRGGDEEFLERKRQQCASDPSKNRMTSINNEEEPEEWSPEASGEWDETLGVLEQLEGWPAEAPVITKRVQANDD
ncbi:MAG: hypothetical protein ACSHXK_10625 [Oceanococcus sp.]